VRYDLKIVRKGYPVSAVFPTTTKNIFVASKRTVGLRTKNGMRTQSTPGIKNTKNEEPDPRRNGALGS